MDHVHDTLDRRTAGAAPARRPEPERGREQELLELQRTAGNRAVVEALWTVQRHSLDPETMDEQSSG